MTKRQLFFIALTGILSSHATHSGDFPQQPFIHVTGEAIQEIAPDRAIISFTISFQRQTFDEAQAQVVERFQFVERTLAKLEIASSQLTAFGFQTRQRSNFRNNANHYTYTCSRNVKLELLDLAKYNAFVNAMHESEGIERFSAVFESCDKEEIRNNLRLQAIMNAKSKAQDQAKAFDCTIGSVFAISEISFPDIGRHFISSAKIGSHLLSLSSTSGSNSSNFYAPGVIPLKASVNVIFLLEN